MNRLQHAGAFVIQFRTGTDFDLGRVEGRVEHVASGRTDQFASADGLLDILRTLLKDVSTPHEEGSRGQTGGGTYENQ